MTTKMKRNPRLEHQRNRLPYNCSRVENRSDVFEGDLEHYPSRFAFIYSSP